MLIVAQASVPFLHNVEWFPTSQILAARNQTASSVETLEKLLEPSHLLHNQEIQLHQTYNQQMHQHLVCWYLSRFNFLQQEQFDFFHLFFYRIYFFYRFGIVRPTMFCWVELGLSFKILILWFEIENFHSWQYDYL